MKKLGKVLLWIFFFPVMLTIFLVNKTKLKKGWKIAIVVGFWIIAFANGISEEIKESETSETTKESVETMVEASKPEEKPIEKDDDTDVIDWWSNLNEPALKDDITSAFAEIGEKPEYIISIEHVKDIKTDLFIRREYKLCFDKGNITHLFNDDKKHFIHAVEWRLTTEEWYDGEPEKEEYPREYLVSIKFWYDDDSTNILQWSHTGNGKLQGNE